MAKTCVTEKTADRQRWIENGLLTLMLQKQYSRISVTDLCSHLQLPRRSFYRYFNDLDDVLNSLMEHTFQQLVLVPREPSVQDLQRGYEFWLERRDLLDALYHGGLMEKLFEFTLRYTGFHNANAAANGPEPQKDTQLFIISGFVSLIISWYSDGFQKTPEQMARISHKMLYEPFLKKP